ncbi:MAG: tRNA dihydrouridine synthase DusB, partial [Betaproteobacteria bacterium]|nr:tRNA dihydrouridine synthase DusB [Betaproteobacteria bacterium]
GWYVRALPGGEALRGIINTIDDPARQESEVTSYFDALAQRMDRLPGAGEHLAQVTEAEDA